MTLDEFVALIEADGWERTQSIEIVDTRAREEDDYEDDEYVRREILVTWGYASLVSKKDGVEIEFVENWQMGDHMPDTFETYAADEEWRIEGVEVVDEDGDPIRDRDLVDCLTEAFNGINYSDFIEEMNPTEDIDIDEESEMETITLENDNAPDVRFTGELVASASSSANNASSSYSGSTGRWTTLKLYKTVGGKFVCQSIGHTQWQGEHNRYKTKVCATEAEVVDFFGHGWLAKELYFDVGIADVQDVE